MFRESVALTVGIVGGMGLGVILYHVNRYAFVGFDAMLVLIAIYIMYNTPSRQSDE